MSPTVVTLLTDFGADGPYVAAMKGVLLGMNRSLQLVDISHAIGPQSIRQAALCLAQTAPYYPPGTIHVVVVDPGVGTTRRLLCASLYGQFFLAPDNGVLSWTAENVLANWGRDQPAVEGAVPRQKIFQLTQARFWQGMVSSTFHGRDILAPVAGHLSLGIQPHDLGPEIADYVRLPWPAVRNAGGIILGQVVAVDHFGNLITNIRRHELPLIGATGAAGTVTLAAVAMPLRQTYADVAEGEVLALIGSSGLLEIAVRNGNAAAQLQAGVGLPVSVELR